MPLPQRNAHAPPGPAHCPPPQTAPWPPRSRPAPRAWARAHAGGHTHHGRGRRGPLGGGKGVGGAGGRRGACRAGRSVAEGSRRVPWSPNPPAPLPLLPQLLLYGVVQRLVNGPHFPQVLLLLLFLGLWRARTRMSVQDEQGRVGGLWTAVAAAAAQPRAPLARSALPWGFQACGCSAYGPARVCPVAHAPARPRAPHTPGTRAPRPALLPAPSAWPSASPPQQRTLPCRCPRPGCCWAPRPLPRAARAGSLASPTSRPPPMSPPCWLQGMMGAGP